MDVGSIRIAPERAVVLQEKAKELEAAFLAEMLKHIGFSGASGAFSGGAGEEQFKSFLLQAQAQALVEKGGVGLAETIFRSLVESEEMKNVGAIR